jgi:hypothetical protein
MDLWSRAMADHACFSYTNQKLRGEKSPYLISSLKSFRKTKINN